MSADATVQAQLLLEAQVQFWLRELTPDRLRPLLREEVQYLYEQLDHIRLNEAVSADRIKATAHRYALEMEIGGAIPELFGEIASLVYAHPAQDSARISDIFSSHIAQEFLDKVFEPGSLLDRAFLQIQRSEPFKAFLADVSLLAIKGFLQDKNRPYNRLPLIGSGLRRAGKLVQDYRPQWQENLEQTSHELLHASIGRSVQLLDQLLDQSALREQALAATLNLWDEISTWPASRFRDFTTENDLQELMVLGYEFWRAFRETEYLTAIIDTAVDFFFSKYGEESLQKIISEMGVTYAMIESDILDYGSNLGSLLRDKGIAETILRRQLGRFYFSPDTLALLDSHSAPG